MAPAVAVMEPDIDTLTPPSTVPISTNYQRLWTRQIALSHEPPLLVDGTVIVLSPDGTVYELDAKDGHTIWNNSLVAAALLTPYRKAPLPNGVARSARLQDNPSPTVVGDLILVSYSTLVDGYVFAVERKTGAVRWHYQMPHPPDGIGKRCHIFTSPVVCGDTVVVRTSLGLTALALTTGMELWRVLTTEEHSVLMPILSNPVIDPMSKTVFLNADLGTAHAFRLTDGKRLWSVATNANHQTTVTNIRERHITAHRTTPLLIENLRDDHSERLLVIANGLGRIYAIDIRTIRPVWQTDIGAAWQLVDARGFLYAATSKGFVEIDKRDGSIVRSLTLPGGAYSCIVGPTSALIAGNPNEQPGWRLLDLLQWKVAASVTDVQVRQGMAADGQLVVVGGRDVIERTGQSISGTSVSPTSILYTYGPSPAKPVPAP